MLAILNGVVRGEEIRGEEIHGEEIHGEEISVSVDPRVELVCIVFRLAGHFEYNQARVKRYAVDVDTHFAPGAGSCGGETRTRTAPHAGYRIRCLHEPGDPSG